VSPGRLRELIRKEMKQMLRDPKMKRIIFAAPVIQLLVFGYAVNTDVRNAPTILVDQDNTPTSRALADALEFQDHSALEPEWGHRSGTGWRVRPCRGAGVAGLRARPPGGTQPSRSGAG